MSYRRNQRRKQRAKMFAALPKQQTYSAEYRTTPEGHRNLMDMLRGRH